MGLFLELLLTAFVTLLISFIVAKLVSVPSSEEKTSIVDKKKKGVEEEVKLEKGLKVVRAKSKKRVKFVDDDVVRNIDHFESSEEPIKVKDFEVFEKMSGKVGILDKSFEGAAAVKRGGENKVVEGVYGYESEGVDKKSELLPCGEKIFEGSKDVGLLLDEALDREIGEEKNEDAKVDEFCGVKGGDAVASGLEGLVVEEEMKSEGIVGGDGLKLINDDVGSDKNDNVAGGERVADNAEFLDKPSEREDVEEKSEHIAIGVDKISGGKLGNVRVGSGVLDLEDLVVQENIKSEGFGGESEVSLASDDIAIPQNEESRVDGVSEVDVIGTEEGFSKDNVRVEEGILRDESIGGSDADADGDDDWEGVERSELEKVFAEAVNYVEYGGKRKDDQLASLKSDVQMQLYGLHKLAVEGPCHEPQPMALKFSARAKWNAWQRLGSMRPEVAMEEYIKILSDTDPGWMKHSSAQEDDKHHSLETRIYGDPDTNLSAFQDPQENYEVGR
ncbi:hypothetical protein ACH5RR_034912 [Cinchona calisaya]|uniref:ACB domain-containing protein n=1 Tax=Cinchona calisaya TaxID=153742 RepID=A0ABD2YCB4_9GENT